mmetsp:Transcript_24524/g.35658  ORF Transcript_24524/g.35658 Transcript_24524/m.35658 type:complete len:261 (-) Transcript_24524:81-863(-)
MLPATPLYHEMQPVTHHYRIAQELNNMGVTMLRMGLLEDAAETFLEAFLAMRPPEPTSSGVEPPSPSDDKPISTDADNRIQKARARLPAKSTSGNFITRNIGSVKNYETMDNTLFTAPLYSDVALVKNGIVKSEKFSNLFLALSNTIVVHNMALVYHILGFKTNSTKKIRKALSLYQKAHSQLMRIGYFEQEEAFVGKTFLLKLEVAILNNMGQIFHEIGEHEDASLCLEVLSVLQGKVSFFCLMLSALLMPSQTTSAAA